MIAGVAVAASMLVGLLLPVPAVEKAELDMEELRSEPEVNMDLTLRSGPIVIELGYRVELEQARDQLVAYVSSELTQVRA